jgi:uncharacterized protein YgbK (DUF1537 family)
MSTMPQWGCIADDVTGATDLAGNFVARGYSSVVVFGPAPLRDQALLDSLRAVDAVVVAVKSRNAGTSHAVAMSMEALSALELLEAGQIYVKYCSTFDSTPSGNIGPTIDAVLARTGADLTVVVPSFPDAGRTVYQGHLFVGSQLLSESSMRHHPLNPMEDSDVRRLLAPQTRNRVAHVGLDVVRQGPCRLRAALDACRAPGQAALVVVDAVAEDDLAVISRATARMRVVTGGSGLALGLEATRATADARAIPTVAGRRAALCGSASERSREQVAHAKRRLPCRKIDLSALMAAPAAETKACLDWALACWDQDRESVPLVYSVDDLADVVHAGPGFQPAAAVEKALARVAQGLAAAGLGQLIVAGGETAGRVISELGVSALRIGPAIAPGVSWGHAATAAGRSFNLALKSGNFGAPDLFEAAWELLEEPAAQR